MSVGRLVAGLLVALAVLATATVFVLGFWNPWELVVLRQHFANPWLGTWLVGVGGYLALWLLAPVRVEARQRWRISARVITGVVAVFGLVCWGLFSPLFAYEATELARSDDGERVVVDVTAGGMNERDLRIWEGSGLAAREVGSFGKPCASPQAEFAGPDVVVINQGHGDWQFHLDPETGEPLHVFGPRCSDGPMPATMGQ